MKDRIFRNGVDQASSIGAIFVEQGPLTQFGYDRADVAPELLRILLKHVPIEQLLRVAEALVLNKVV